MSVDMKTMREQMLAEEEKAKRQYGDGASYPFWETPEGQPITLRFLPDANTENPFFWVNREIIKLAFADNVVIQVPCMNMFGLPDKIIEYARPWWKDPAKIETARQYYKKKSWITQGFVVTSAITEKSAPPENPIRRFVLNKGLFEIVKAALMNPDLENNPTDYDNGGRDFRVVKTKKGEHADYSTSGFAFKTRALNATEKKALVDFGLVDLKTSLGRVPDKDEQDAIYVMFLASLRGDPYDVSSWGKYFKPWSPNTNGASEQPPLDKATVTGNAQAMLAAIHKNTRNIVVAAE